MVDYTDLIERYRIALVDASPEARKALTRALADAQDGHQTGVAFVTRRSRGDTGDTHTLHGPEQSGPLAEVEVDRGGATRLRVIRSASEARALYTRWHTDDRDRVSSQVCNMHDQVWFTIVNRAEHSGHVTWEYAEGDWTYQDLTAPHSTVLYQGVSETEARTVLADYLICDAPEKGHYCYTHNPSPALVNIEPE